MSKEKLTIEHLAPYLPYGVKCWVKDYTEIGKQPINNAYTLNAVYSDGSCVFYDLVESSQGFKEVKLILRPLSDLTKEIEHNGDKFVPLIKMGLPNKTRVYNDITYIIKKGHTPYIEMQKLLEWHFDVFDLHSKGLCIYKDEI